MRAIVALAVGVALIALAAAVFLAPRPSTQTVALEPIQAQPQQSATPPAAPPVTPIVKPVQPLKPRADTPATPSVAPSPEPSENPPETDPPSPPAATNPTDSPPAPPTTQPTTSQPSSLPVRQTAQGWSVQAGAYKTESNATAMRDRLLKAGLAARVEKGDDAIYRVMVGAYTSGDAARASSAAISAALK